jgi:hypothetical protein
MGRRLLRNFKVFDRTCVLEAHSRSLAKVAGPIGAEVKSSSIKSRAGKSHHGGRRIAIGPQTA